MVIKKINNEKIYLVQMFKGVVLLIVLWRLSCVSGVTAIKFCFRSFKVGVIGSELLIRFRDFKCLMLVKPPNFHLKLNNLRIRPN